MELFKKSEDFGYEMISRGEQHVAKIKDLKRKIERLYPVERIAIYMHTLTHGDFDPDYGYGYEYGYNRTDTVWLDQILEAAELRISSDTQSNQDGCTILSLKEDSVWDGPMHKPYMEIAKPLVEKFGFDKAAEVIEIIHPILGNSINKLPTMDDEDEPVKQKSSR